MKKAALTGLMAVCGVVGLTVLGGCMSSGHWGADGGGDTAGDGAEPDVVGGSAGGDTIKVVKKSLASLVAVDNCDKVLDQLKKRAVEETDKILEDNLQQALQFLEGGGGYCMTLALDGGGGASVNGVPVRVPAQETGASQYSTTNTQVAGVDEADFVKNDDRYIYIVADGKFQIIDAWPAAQAHTIASMPVTGTPTKLYVENNIAVVYSSLGVIEQASQDVSFFRYAYLAGDPQYDAECTYGYSCDFAGDGHKLAIYTYDISDKTAPRLLRQTELSGSYLNSRRVGSIVHTVVTFPEIAIPGLEYWPAELEEYRDVCGLPDNFPYTEQDIRALFDEVKAKNRSIVDASTIADYLPGLKDTRYINGNAYSEEGLLNSCNNFYLSQTGDGRGFLALVSFNMSALDSLNATTIVGKPGAVYASPQALYVAVRHYSDAASDWFFEDKETLPEATTVHKFALKPGSIATSYVGSGVTKGLVLNQFSMDENQGFLRIATTTGHVPDPGVHSTLSVLAESAGGLSAIGMVDKIAPEEDIRAVRFSGDQGFVVTFKKTDPLFVFDLSNPRKPVMKGELKVPGFSTYIHLMDAIHLLTMGYDAADQGTFAWFQGIQLQIVDIAKIDDPKLLYKEVIGTRGSTSDAATDHLAFNYFPERKLLAIPMTICEGASGSGTYGDIMTFGGLLVYRVSVDGGFTKLGGVPHETPETADKSRGACNNWWTDSNSKVKRSIFMSSGTEDFVYSIALDLINVSSLKDLEHPLVSIGLVASP